MDQFTNTVQYGTVYLMGPLGWRRNVSKSPNTKRKQKVQLTLSNYYAGPKSALFLRVALIKAGVRGAGVIKSILKREYHVIFCSV